MCVLRNYSYTVFYTDNGSKDIGRQYSWCMACIACFLMLHKVTNLILRGWHQLESRWWWCDRGFSDKSLKLDQDRLWSAQMTLLQEDHFLSPVFVHVISQVLVKHKDVMPHSPRSVDIDSAYVKCTSVCTHSMLVFIFVWICICADSHEVQHIS